jgi:ribosomal-protein-alanine N-acetyltransferase
MIYLETDRLLLRSWHDGDLEPFAAMNANETVMEFYPTTLDPNNRTPPQNDIKNTWMKSGSAFLR